jgi:RNA polymerase sigma-70 factor (ECF subfamily)
MVSPLHEVLDFQTFYHRAQRTVFRYAAVLCDNLADAEDVTAEAFLKAWRARASFDGDADAALGWLITIVRNLVFDRRRAALRAPAAEVLDDTELDSAAAPDTIVLANEQLDLVLALIRELPEQQRDALILRHVLGWRVNQIGAHLGIAENTVSVNLRRAVQRLQQQLARSTEVPIG